MNRTHISNCLRVDQRNVGLIEQKGVCDHQIRMYSTNTTEGFNQQKQVIARKQLVGIQPAICYSRLKQQILRLA